MNYLDLFKFYQELNVLKTTLRSGWVIREMNVDRLESVAEHVFTTTLMAYAIIEENKLNINMSKVIKMLLIHELGEIKIGDLTPHHKVEPLQKHEMEKQAMIEILKPFNFRTKWLKLWLEFEEKQTPEAQFAYKMDKLDANLQAKDYSIKTNVNFFKMLYDYDRPKVGEYSEFLDIIKDINSNTIKDEEIKLDLTKIKHS
jgi:putative hydrolase of HD superfamily